jgi:hypothetical protein
MLTERPAMLRCCFILVTFLACGLFCSGFDINAPPDPLTFQWATDNPDLVTPAMLKDPANGDVFRKLKERALTTHNYDATLTLVRYGDPEVISDCVARYRARDVNCYPDRALERSNNLDVISLIGQDLNRNESAYHREQVGECFILDPISVQTARIIRTLILNSSEFSPAIRSWAKNLPMDYNLFRQSMRTWWNQNESFLKARQYDRVEPPG